MSLASDRQAQIVRADRIAATLPGPDLPGWVHRPPGPDSWAPRLVHLDGASVMVTCVGARLLLRAVLPDGLSHHQWDPLEISVAADAARSWIVSNFSRRLATPLLPQHAAAVQILLREERAHQAKDAVRDRLRPIIPAAVLSSPWPSDVHDARWYSGAGQHSGRVRVVSADSVDLELNSLTPDEAARVLAALFDSTPSTTPALTATQTTPSTPSTRRRDRVFGRPG
jgi:hypothetical protein